MDGGKADDAGVNIRALIFALLALACGHMLSTLLRTIPAISLDVMAADFATPPQTLASLTSIYHFAFAASQIPVGAAMDRFGVRPVSLSLLARNHRRRAGVRPRHRAGEFSVRTIPARCRHLGHADVPDDAGRQADVGGAVRPVVRHYPVDRQYRHAAVVEPAGLCRRTLGMAGRVLDLRRLRRGGGIAVYALVPNQPAAHADRSSPLSQMAKCCASACRVRCAA